MNRPTLARAEFTPSQLAQWSVAVLAVSSLLAWLPTLQSQILVAEDHHFVDLYKDGYLQGVGRSFVWYGVWRIFGLSLVGLTSNLHPLAYPVLALLTHLAAVSAFVSACSRLLGNRRAAIGLGFILATLPLGYQALVWGVCYPFILASLVFWTQVWVIASRGDVVEKQASVFAASGLLTLLGALSNECLLGASLGICAWSWLRERPLSLQGLRRDMKIYYAGWAPFVGAAVYVAGHYVFRPDFVLKEPGVFNPRSLLSAYYHTTSALAVWAAWGSPPIRDLGFDSWTTGATVWAMALAVVLAALATYGFPRIPVRDEEPPSLFRVGATIGCILFGTSLIYAIGGGFSPESRKLYPICYVMALAAGFVLVRLSVNRAIRPAIVAVAVMCCVPTAWLLTGVWRFEAIRGRALAQTIAENDIHSPIELRSDTDPHEAWPYLTKSYGFRLYDPWLLNYTLGSMFPGHGADLRDDTPGKPIVLRYERRSGWSIVSESASPPR